MPTANRPVIDRLTVQNYRVLRHVTFDELTPLTVPLGPNGSGKSTVFDVFAFLNEAFTTNLRRAWDRRNRLHEIRSRGATGPIVFELKYRETRTSKRVTYKLAIDEERGSPVVVEEVLQWTIAPRQGRPKDILRFSRGSGFVYDESSGDRSDESLDTPDLLAVSTLGQLSRHPRVAALRRFITGWYLSYVSADSTRSLPESGPQERLSQTGDNLPNVIQYLQEQHPDRLAMIFRRLGERVPNLEKLEPEPLADGRLRRRSTGCRVTQSDAGDDPFTLLCGRTAADGAVDVVQGKRRIHPRPEGLRCAATSCHGRVGRPAGLAVDGRLHRRRRSAGAGRTAPMSLPLEVHVEELSAEYAGPEDARVIVLIDRNNDDCRDLRRRLDDMARAAGLSSTGRRRAVLNRIAIEELEAWFFGDPDAITAAYPKVPLGNAARRGLRDPDAIAGGTAQALERLLQKYGYHNAGLAELEAARCIADQMNVEQNNSRSFQVFRDGVRSFTKGQG